MPSMVGVVAAIEVVKRVHATSLQAISDPVATHKRQMQPGSNTNAPVTPNRTLEDDPSQALPSLQP